jgi:amidase
MKELLAATAGEQAGAVREGEVTAGELVEAAVRRAEGVQAELGAFALIDGEGAIAAAAEVGAGDPRPFAGVPYAVKDLALACAGMPFTNGSKLFGDFTPPHDSVAVARARDAGLIVIGKTVSCEFGLLPVTEPARFGPVRNPHDPERSAGGSSGGAAAAVAGGALAVASASDAGGSIRIPAASCGLVGLKPTRGRVSLGPELAEHPLAVEGCVTRDVADSAAMLDALAGPSVGDATWAPPPERAFAEAAEGALRCRIAVCGRPPFDAEVDAPRLDALSAAAKALEDAGHELVELDPSAWDATPVLDAFLDLWSFGAASFAGFGEMVAGGEIGPETLEPLTLAFVQRGAALSAPQLAGAQQAIQGWSRATITALDDYDAVLSPALACPPPPLGSFDDPAMTPERALEIALEFTPFTPIANLTGQPALAVPRGFDPDGLPVAVQLLGRPADEGTLLALGSQLERAEASA